MVLLNATGKVDLNMPALTCDIDLVNIFSGHEKAMSPSVVNGVAESDGHAQNNEHEPSKLIRQPMRTAGLLETYAYTDATPIIGREFRELQIADLMKAPNRDELIRDLAINGRIEVMLACTS